MDYIVRATAADGQIRAFAATTRETVETARQDHNTSPVATAALGRLLTAGAMMGVMMKGDKDILTLQVKGDGPIQGITVTADSKGRNQIDASVSLSSGEQAAQPRSSYLSIGAETRSRLGDTAGASPMFAHQYVPTRTKAQPDRQSWRRCRGRRGRSPCFHLPTMPEPQRGHV